MVNRKPDHYVYLYTAIIVLLLALVAVVTYLIYVLHKPKEKIIVKHIEKEYIPVESDPVKTSTVLPNKLPEYNNPDYQQVGILTANESDKEPIVLPLFAKKIRNNRDRWNYYTATDKNNMMRLPITYQNMNCDDNIGCREINDGDTLGIEIYKGRIFTATIYKTQSPQYFADVY